jgi:hypothetical protein
MTNLLTTILLISIFLLSCTTNEKQVKSELPKDTASTASYFKIDKDSITVLPFEIAITLSPKAKNKIIDSKETIIVNVSLTSSPKDKKNAPAGESPIHKQKRKKEKLIRLDDLIPKGKVSGGRQFLFGATDINQTTNRTRRDK